MIAVSNTSPISYLASIDLLHLLPKFFNTVYLPKSVVAELQSPFAPPAVHKLLNALPPWMRIADHAAPPPLSPRLDVGELAVMEVGRHLPGPILLLDDWHAREMAKRLGFVVAGTVGILARSAKSDFIDWEESIAKLRSTNFHISDQVLSEAKKLL